jgi:hypothetical protein
MIHLRVASVLAEILTKYLLDMIRDHYHYLTLLMSQDWTVPGSHSAYHILMKTMSSVSCM